MNRRIEFTVTMDIEDDAPDGYVTECSKRLQKFAYEVENACVGPMGARVRVSKAMLIDGRNGWGQTLDDEVARDREEEHMQTNREGRLD
jgi:hypothetical protein